METFHIILLMAVTLAAGITLLSSINHKNIINDLREEKKDLSINLDYYQNLLASSNLRFASTSGYLVLRNIKTNKIKESYNLPMIFFDSSLQSFIENAVLQINVKLISNNSNSILEINLDDGYSPFSEYEIWEDNHILQYKHDLNDYFDNLQELLLLNVEKEANEADNLLKSIEDFTEVFKNLREQGLGKNPIDPPVQEPEEVVQEEEVAEESVN